ncbi:MAG: ABC transporter ATP-binding protein [Bacteroidia bacterium]|nr:ABC transporter ATP-binding protein [Bacteroidia bacterium]
MSTAIEFNNISKQYRLGLVSTRTLSHDLNRWWKMNILGKEDPYLKIGEVNDRAHRGESEYVWALRDIDFKVEQGDVLGIIGKNGAGKSTLLKILSKVTTPSTGTIKARGRIASLLEVGTGFHPEMTGRENIYMNGAILGMSKNEIARKLDEIVDFSGVERYLDTPVKRYSSGMTVRLGFAIAAHLEPEILVVDEVLAVGDAEFQKKAIGKMQDVSKGEGRTVLFVSHNMGAVRNLCKSAVVLKDGIVDYKGEVDEAIDYYLKTDKITQEISVIISEKNRKKDMPLNVQFISAHLFKNKNVFATNEPIEFLFKVKANRNVDSFRLNTTVFTMDDIPIGSVSGNSFFSIKRDEEKMIKFTLINHNLAIAEYKTSFSLGTGNYSTGQTDYDIISDILTFKIDKFDSESNEYYALWNKGWGNVAFQSETIILD